MGDGIQFRSPYNYDTAAASDASAYVETMPSLTVQSMSEDADINVMMKRFGVTGQMPESVRLPQYGDFTEVTDFRSALHAVMDAQEQFMLIPADVRARFENNPQMLLDFVENPGNIEQVKQIFGEKNVSAMGTDSKASASGNGASGAAVAGGNGGVSGNVESGGSASGGA